MRTAIALFRIGLALARGQRSEPITPGGLWREWPFCGAGMGAFAFATGHYFQLQLAIESDTYRPEKKWIWVCSAQLLLLRAGVVWYVLSASAL